MRRALVVCVAVASLAMGAVLQSAEKPVKVKPALLVIDTQNAYLPYMSNQDTRVATEYINAVIKMFRDNGFPVIRVYHTEPGEGPAPGTEAFEFPKTINVRDDDPKVVKTHGNGFRDTDLDKVLRERGSNTLFLTGLSATGCVLATYHGALDRDYDTFMVRDTLMSPDPALTKAVQEMTRTIDYSALHLVLEMAKAQ